MEYIIFFLLIWIGIYIYSVNRQSKAAFLLMLLVALIAFFYIGDFTTRENVESIQADLVWRIISGAYIIPIAILFHLSLIITGNTSRASRYLLFAAYSLAFFLYLIALTTDYFIKMDTVFESYYRHSFIPPRGPLFSLLGVLIVLSFGGGLLNILNAKNLQTIPKRLFASTYFLYLVIGLGLFGFYYFPYHPEILTKLTPFLFVAPLIPILVSIFFFNYPEEISKLINLREAAFSLVLLGAISGIYFAIIYHFFSPTAPEAVLIYFVLIALIILTHTFYDHLTTFVRDLVYNPGGFSILTDSETLYIVNNFHRPEKLESPPLLRFRVVRRRARDGLRLDAGRQLVREAIEYFRQPDYPRRTKQNLKYQILKMITFDEADECQLLRELGFDGYSIRVLSNEEAARKPLFRFESVGDYSATSRNAFVILKKEAIHDLTWRLSYLEKHSR